MSPRIGILTLFGVGLGAFALGGWVFRAESPAGPRDPAATTPALSKTKTPAPVREHAATPRGDQDELLAALRAKLPTSLDEVLRTLTQIGKTNPALAIDLAHALGRTDREKATLVTTAMQQWADREPTAAWRWLRQLTNDRMQELAGGELGMVVLGAMAAHDPQMVVAQLDDLLRNGNTSEAVATPVAIHLGLAALVARSKIDLAKSAVDAWAKDPHQIRLEAAAFETVATSLAKTHPREGGEWLRSLPATEERNAAFATFAAAWASHDPRAALQWAETLPAHQAQQAAIQRVVSDWLEDHPQHVTSWLGDYLTRVPAGTYADRLVETVINNSPTLQVAPQAALQWTNLLSDPAKRVDYHETIAIRWADLDSTAALEFVTKSTVIPPDRKMAVVQKIQLAQIAANRPGG